MVHYFIVASIHNSTQAALYFMIMFWENNLDYMHVASSDSFTTDYSYNNCGKPQFSFSMT